MRAAVPALRRSGLLNANETAVLETPASRATSAMRGRFALTSTPSSTVLGPGPTAILAVTPTLGTLSVPALAVNVRGEIAHLIVFAQIEVRIRPGRPILQLPAPLVSNGDKATSRAALPASNLINWTHSFDRRGEPHIPDDGKPAEIEREVSRFAAIRVRRTGLRARVLTE